jgi:rhamnogalacturonyl hydrolase YesR
MFIFALATGVRKGWLPDQPFRSALEKAWNALSEYLDAEGRVQEVCVGTAALPSKSYYMTRPSKSGDMHGQAGFLWASTAIYLLEKEKSQ